MEADTEEIVNRSVYREKRCVCAADLKRGIWRRAAVSAWWEPPLRRDRPLVMPVGRSVVGARVTPDRGRRTSTSGRAAIWFRVQQLRRQGLQDGCVGFLAAPALPLYKRRSLPLSSSWTSAKETRETLETRPSVTQVWLWCDGMKTPPQPIRPGFALKTLPSDNPVLVSTEPPTHAPAAPRALAACDIDQLDP